MSESKHNKSRRARSARPPARLGSRWEMNNSVNPVVSVGRAAAVAGHRLYNEAARSVAPRGVRSSYVAPERFVEPRLQRVGHKEYKYSPSTNFSQSATSLGRTGGKQVPRARVRQEVKAQLSQRQVENTLSVPVEGSSTQVFDSTGPRLAGLNEGGMRNTAMFSKPATTFNVLSSKRVKGHPGLAKLGKLGPAQVTVLEGTDYAQQITYANGTTARGAEILAISSHPLLMPIPRLNRFAKNFDGFRIDELTYTFYPAASTSSPGEFVAGWDLDPEDTPVLDATANIRNALTHPNAKCSTYYDKTDFHMPTETLISPDQIFLMNDVDEDSRLTVQNLFRVTSLVPYADPLSASTPPGELFVHYRITLVTAEESGSTADPFGQLQPVLAGVTAAAPLGTSASFGVVGDFLDSSRADGGVDLTNQRIYFQPQYNLRSMRIFVEYRFATSVTPTVMRTAFYDAVTNSVLGYSSGDLLFPAVIVTTGVGFCAAMNFTITAAQSVQFRKKWYMLVPDISAASGACDVATYTFLFETEAISLYPQFTETVEVKLNTECLEALSGWNYADSKDGLRPCRAGLLEQSVRSGAQGNGSFRVPKCFERSLAELASRVERHRADLNKRAQRIRENTLGSSDTKSSDSREVRGSDSDVETYVSITSNLAAIDAPSPVRQAPPLELKTSRVTSRK